jgi:hypothetical protein
LLNDACILPIKEAPPQLFKREIMNQLNMDEEKIAEGFIRGFSKLIILLLIYLKPTHGYNLIKEF